MSGLFVDGAAADYGAEDFGFHVLRRRNFCQVVRKDEEVGVFADFQFALLPFLKFCVGRAAGVSADAIFQGDFFLWLPATWWSPVGKPTRYASVESAEGADNLDGIIGAESETRAAFFERGPGVGALDALGTTRDPAQRMSVVWCEGCMEAMTLTLA